MPAGYPLANTSLVGLGVGRGLSVMNQLPSKYSFPGFYQKQKKRTRPDDDSDSDTDNELFFMKDNLPRFIVVQSASEERPLSKLSPFAVQKGFQAIAGTLKSTKRLRDGSFLVDCSRRAQAENLLKTATFVDRPVHVCVHKTLNSSKGVIRCRELSDLSEVEIRDELKTGCRRGSPCNGEERGEGYSYQHPVSYL